MATPHRKAFIGHKDNFWRHSSVTGFDLTHSTVSSPKTHTITIATTSTPVTVDPAKTALVIIDMQNFFLSAAFGRGQGPGHRACDQLIKHAIPAARKAGVRIIWLNWGLDDEEVALMPPAVKRAFGFEANVDDDEEITGTTEDNIKAGAGLGVDKDGSPRHQGGSVTLENGKNGRIYKGLGSPCGTVTDPSTGQEIDAGRLLMRDQWNSALYPPLDKIYQEGTSPDAKIPDVWIHKNRMSGLWGAKTACETYLEENGLQTLLLTGVNTDQCVSGTLTDAFSKGYDCVLLHDGTGTTSPEFAQQGIEFNSGRTWGFSTGCHDFAKGVDGMKEA